MEAHTQFKFWAFKSEIFEFLEYFNDLHVEMFMKLVNILEKVYRTHFRVKTSESLKEFENFHFEAQNSN